MTFTTADLCDRHERDLQVCDPIFRDFGGKAHFFGPIRTVKCFEDNSRVREALLGEGEGGVLVVDAGGSLRCAMLGDQLARLAEERHWAGIILFGCVRDSAQISRMQIGVKALATHPRKSVKRGEGAAGLTVRFAGVSFEPGHFVYCDEDGIVVARESFQEEGR